MNPITLLIYAGIALTAIIVIGLILTRLYRRAPKDAALIRTGFGGEKVILNGGVMVLPVLHELMSVNLTVVKLEVKRIELDALITLDKLRVDVVGLFHIKVKPDVEAISAAAQTLGNRVNDEAAVRNLLDGKLISALRSVAATMTMEDLHKNRASFIQQVQQFLAVDLATNGFELDGVSITHFDQTAFKFFNENNAFDAEGLTVLTRTIEDRKKQRNEIQVENRVAIEQRNFEAEKQSLAIAQNAEQARLEQQQTLAASRSAQATAVAQSQAEQERATEVARITSEQAVKTAEIAREAAVRKSEIERDRNLELARIDTAVATQEKSEAESKARAAADLARADAVRAEEAVKTASATESANRTKNVAVIAAEQKAQEQAVGITIQARAEQEAAEARAAAARAVAEGEADAEKLRADARRVSFEVDAAGQRALNEATNLLSASQTEYMNRKNLIDGLPAIITAAGKPIEAIDRISIIDARGLTGGANDDGPVSGNLADAAVAAAMRYRMHAPLVDGLLGELGLSGASLNSLVGNGASLGAPANATDAPALPSTSPQAEAAE